MEHPADTSPRPLYLVGLLGAVAGIPVAGWLDPRLMAGYLTVLSGSLTLAIMRWWIGAPVGAQVGAVLAAGALPVMAAQFGEQGVYWTLTALPLVLAVQMVIAAPGARRIELLAVELIAMLAAAVPAGYLVLIRQLAGLPGLAVVVASVVSFSAVWLFGSTRIQARTAGVAAVVAAAAISGLAFALAGFGGPVAGAVVGLGFGMAATLGSRVGQQLAGSGSEAQVAGSVLVALLGVPAYFYGLTLFLR